MEKAAMKLKRNDALALLKRLRQQRYRSKMYLLEVYGTANQNKASKVLKKINKNAREYKKTLLKEKFDKCDHLKAKYKYTREKTLKSCPGGVRSLLEQLEIFNTVPTIDPPLGPMICHPSINLNKEELAVLNRGPKFMVRNRVSRSDFLLEVEKGIVKHKYNVLNNDPLADDNITQNQNGGNTSNTLRAEQILLNYDCFQILEDGRILEGGQNRSGMDTNIGSGGTEEDTSIADNIKKIEVQMKSVYNHDEKSVSLGRMKCTDFKYNKRIRLPGPDVESQI